MVNALRLAARIVAALPADTLTPETTDGREGFIHPYEIDGTAGRAEIRAILRDFDDAQLAATSTVRRDRRGDRRRASRARGVEVAVRDQYRNMRRRLEPIPDRRGAAERDARRGNRADAHADPRRHRRLAPEREGLPTPNIFAGGHESHSVREWASLQDMAAAAATLVRLAGGGRGARRAERGGGCTGGPAVEDSGAWSSGSGVASVRDAEGALAQSQSAERALEAALAGAVLGGQVPAVLAERPSCSGTSLLM